MSYSITQTRQALKDALAQFTLLWAGKSEDDSVLLDNVAWHGIQHGELQGKTALLDALAKDRAEHILQIDTTNVYLAGKGERAAVSAYVYGALQNDSEKITFHGMLVMQLAKTENRWQISDIRIQHGADGAISPKHWTSVQRLRQGWQKNAPTPVIISEFDSPWALFQENEFAPQSDEEAVAELYGQYAWGLDFRDFHLLADVWATEVSADLTPIPEQHGRRNVYGQLRELRLAAGYWFHATKPLAVKVVGERAEVLLGRIVSAQTEAEGQPLYVANYKAELVKEADGKWRYSRFYYSEGWFTYDEA